MKTEREKNNQIQYKWTSVVLGIDHLVTMEIELLLVLNNTILVTIVTILVQRESHLCNDTQSLAFGTCLYLVP